MILQIFPKISQQFDAMHMAETIHHAWLLQGEEGIGKRLLAEAFALKLLGDNPKNKRLMEQRAHPDYKIIDRAQATKTGVLSVETVRSALPFMRETRVIAPYRVLIIDALDHLNRNAANAALKLVEEPQPNTVMFLINHARGRILPTLKSRCRTVYIPTPKISPDTFNEALQFYNGIDQPDLYNLSGGKLGVALRIGEQQEKHLQAFKTLTGSTVDIGSLQEATIALKENLLLKRLAAENLLNRLHQHIKKLALRQNPEKQLNAYAVMEQRFQDVETLNLDWGEVFVQNYLESLSFMQN